MSRFEGTQRHATPGNPQIMQRKVEDEPGSSIVRMMAEAAKGRDYGDVRDLLNSYSSVLAQQRLSNSTIARSTNPYTAEPTMQVGEYNVPLCSRPTEGNKNLLAEDDQGVPLVCRLGQAAKDKNWAELKTILAQTKSQDTPAEQNAWPNHVKYEDGYDRVNGDFFSADYARLSATRAMGADQLSIMSQMPTHRDPTAKMPQAHYVDPLHFDRRDHHFPQRANYHDQGPSASLALTEELLRIRRKSGDPSAEVLDHHVALRRKDRGPQHANDFSVAHVTGAEIQKAIKSRLDAAAAEATQAEKWRILGKAPPSGHLCALLNETPPPGFHPAIEDARQSVLSSLEFGRLRATLDDRLGSDVGAMARIQRRIAAEQ